MDDDDNLSPVARACVNQARHQLAVVNGKLTPTPRPYVPPVPVTPAERVQADVWRCDRCDEPLDGMGACWRCDDQEDDE